MVVMTAMLPDPVEQVLVEDLVGVVLAAGEGVRLRPLTLKRPKPLCPVDNVPLLDHARLRAASVTADIAVNVHHGREAIAAHLDGTAVHLSVEEDEALGTAGALGHLRDWIAGRDAVVLNGDTWCPGALEQAVAGWDRERVRLLVAGGDELRPNSQLAGAFMPWAEIAPLAAEPSGLYEVSWRRLIAEGRVDVVRWDGPCFDCGTPQRYLAANMAATEADSVIGPGSKIHGTVERSVVWEDTEVYEHEHLVDAIRGDGLTVLVRSRLSGG
jgi:N-acetyl-alpha-D-muramate 1-phosphate uridylyltransferase